MQMRLESGLVDPTTTTPADAEGAGGPGAGTEASATGGGPLAAGAARRGAAIFALAIFMAALLLFLVQPIMGRYILPWFGGSRGVWTTCMLFFQAMLLLGYAYAHLSARFLPPWGQAAAHLAVLAAAALMLPIAPAEAWKPVDASAPTWRILGLLTATLGLPYFALSATGPLLQAWFSGLNSGAAPYRLYALSNLGSMLALAAYPFAVEPLLGRAAQVWLWSWAMGAFAVICAACALMTWGAGDRRRPSHASAIEGWRAAPSAVALWVALPACASMLLLAVTSRICQDLAVVPFLWVAPLALYLLSFVLCFDSLAWYPRPVFLFALLATGAAVIGMMHGDNKPPMMAQVGVWCGALFIFCMVCHGELARLKPPPAHLTGYYLAIATGGAAGGAFVALAAPLLFPAFWELHLAMLGTFVLLVVAMLRDRSSEMYQGRSPAGLAALVVVGLCGTWYLYQDMRFTDRQADRLTQRRSFHGALTVSRHPPGASNRPEYLLLRHGAITHGIQMTPPELRRVPTAYYGTVSPAVQVLARMTQRPVTIGVVGLGVGTMAAHGRPGDRVVFYEIDPTVLELAREYFTYLADCEASVEVVLGDARLSLEREAPRGFDLLVLDAFSSDAIPTHLLTLEAIGGYMRHMKPDGVIAIHISNRYLHLQPPVERVAGELGLAHLTLSSEGAPHPWYEYASLWTLLSRDEQRLRPEGFRGTILAPPQRQVRLWTDDYVSILEVLR